MLRGVLVVVIVFLLTGFASMITYERVTRYLGEHKPDPSRIEAALDSLYATLSPLKIESKASVEEGIRCDRLLFDRKTSLTRVNLQIARSVESRGGEIAYGFESSDNGKDIQCVTIGISDGEKLLREVILKKKLK